MTTGSGSSGASSAGVGGRGEGTRLPLTDRGVRSDGPGVPTVSGTSEKRSIRPAIGVLSTPGDKRDSSSPCLTAVPLRGDGEGERGGSREGVRSRAGDRTGVGLMEPDADAGMERNDAEGEVAEVGFLLGVTLLGEGALDEEASNIAAAALTLLGLLPLRGAAAKTSSGGLSRVVDSLGPLLGIEEPCSAGLEGESVGTSSKTSVSDGVPASSSSSAARS